MRFLRFGMISLVLVGAQIAPAAPPRLQPVVFDHARDAQFQFGSYVGERIDANREQWLLRAPTDNPGLLEMFALRDRGPVDQVDWAGEFAGKYLISGVQALRMSDDPRLARSLREFVSRLISLQDVDGYLGPWPKKERLLSHWDLWGHYHILLGLLQWHEYTHDEEALASARKIADLVCQTYLDGSRRPFDAGAQEMNLSAIHGLALLYERTGEPRYRRMCEEFVKDFERAGDYLRTGVAGVEYYKSPRPRWESLHAIQGLAEMWRITGDERYRRAFLHHWASIRRHDVRNTGGFSGGEQATGNPYAESAIETCCTVAWTAVMIDALRLTGDSTIADDLELTFYNAILGAQHPSGRWWTYDTPMNGRRIPSYEAIAFQIRPGGRELNCCSVNGPRGLGMLSEWAVMQNGNRVVVNYLGPMAVKLTVAGKPVQIDVASGYPAATASPGKISVQVTNPEQAEFQLAMRIPAWAKNVETQVGQQAVADVPAGQYWETACRAAELKLQLKFAIPLCIVPGDREQLGKASVYFGPLLLARDESRNPRESTAPITLITRKSGRETTAELGEAAPWFVKGFLDRSGQAVVLCDFTHAGDKRTPYRTWLPMQDLSPSAPAALRPTDGLRVPPGAIVFTWRKTADLSPREVVIAESPTFKKVVCRSGAATGGRLVLPKDEAAKLTPGAAYYWKLVAQNAFGQTESLAPHKSFVIDDALPPAAEVTASPYGERSDDAALIVAPLSGALTPEYGTRGPARGWKEAEGPDGAAGTAVETNGGWDSVVTFDLEQFPEENYSVILWVLPHAFPQKGVAQICSGWCQDMDDPLRLVLENRKVFARLEAGKTAYSTDGVLVETGKWLNVAAVKNGETLTLYVNGMAQSSAKVPRTISTQSTRVALGGNPLYRGAGEFLAARFSNFRLYARALSEAEVGHLAGRKQELK